MEELLKVEDMMDRQFVTLGPEMKICDAINVLLKQKMTGAIVVDENYKPLGILGERECLRILLFDSFYDTPDSQVKHYMYTDMIIVESSLDIISAAQIFIDHKFRRLPVVDSGKLVGQITRRDILRGMREHNRLHGRCV